jgi:PAS domain S-box-containing protein
MSDSKKTILIVEDEALIALNEALILEKHGFNVIPVYNAQKAIKSANEKEIDLILMDIDLGKGKMDGTQAAERILEEHDIPIVFLSSHTEPEVVEKTEKITSYGYVVKNSGETVLIASLNMAFKLHQAYKDIQQSRESLRESEERYRLLAEYSTDVIAFFDSSFKPLYISPSAEKFFGYSLEDFTDKTVFDFVHPDDGERLQQNIREHMTNRAETARQTFRILDADRQSRWIETSSRYLYDDSGQLQNIVVNIRDITQRKHYEHKLAATARENEYLREITLALASTTDKEELLDRLIDYAGKLVPFTAVNICELHGEKLEVARQRGYKQYGVQKTYIESLFTYQEMDNIKQMVRTHKPVLIPDTKQSPAWKEFEATSWVRSYMGFPIIYDDELIGFMNFDSETPDEFGEEDVSKLKPFISAAAVALQKANLFEKVQRELREGKNTE